VCGHPQEAAVLAEKARSLSPLITGMLLGTIGHAYHYSGRYEEAIAAFQAYHARSPGFGLVDLVLIYIKTGRLEEAKEAAKALMAARPGFTIGAWAETQYFRRDKAVLAAEIAILKEAGLLEG
jgi:adenylate cyclase